MMIFLLKLQALSLLSDLDQYQQSNVFKSEKDVVFSESFQEQNWVYL